jgi:Domain of unknown function (DUF4082)
MDLCRLTAAVLLTFCSHGLAQTSFWTSSTIPGTREATHDTASVTLGLRFSSEVAGSVTGVRFYKGSRNTGTHIGTLWSNTGARLASVTFSGETASGWQQANFSSPISIQANTTYVISYLAPRGNYAVDQNYSWSTLNARPLRVSGSSPGVFAYGSDARFPNGTWNRSNYWVEPVFVAASGGGPSDSQTSFWNNSTNPGTREVTNDSASVTLGLKFYSTVPGSITAVRFYKGPRNTGTHAGALWSSTGARLGSVTFTGETASGWQQANFSSPISIAANTTYVISYLAPRGYYAIDQNYPWSTLKAGSLRVSGSSPGVFAYGSSTRFPNGTWNRSNYWVEPVFSTAGGTNPTNPTNPTDPTTPPDPPSTYTISGRVTGSSARLTLSGVSSGSTTTDGSGNYSFSGLRNGSYIVAASQSGYTFTPSTASATIRDASVGNVNFTGTAVTAPISRRVTLSWTASTSQNIRGYHVYRADVAGGNYNKLTASPVSGTSYVDSSVTSGRTYYYVATAIDSNNMESAHSNQATAPVPAP